MEERGEKRKGEQKEEEESEGFYNSVDGSYSHVDTLPPSKSLFTMMFQLSFMLIYMNLGWPHQTASSGMKIDLDAPSVTFGWWSG